MRKFTLRPTVRGSVGLELGLWVKPWHKLQLALPTSLFRFPIPMVFPDDASVAISQCRASFGTLCVVNSGTVKLMMLSGTDCGLLLHISMDGPSTALRNLERAGGINLPDVDNRTGIVKYGWNE